MKKSVFALFLTAAAPLCAELLPAEIGLGWANGWVREWRAACRGSR